MSVCILLKYFPKSFSSWWKMDTLHSELCPSVYLEWVSVLILFPNRSTLKEIFVSNSQKLQLLYILYTIMGYIFKYFIWKMNFRPMYILFGENRLTTTTKRKKTRSKTQKIYTILINENVKVYSWDSSDILSWQPIVKNSILSDLFLSTALFLKRSFS